MKSFPLSVLTFLGHISQEAPISQEWGNDSFLFFFFMVSLLWNTSVLSLTSITKILERSQFPFTVYRLHHSCKGEMHTGTGKCYKCRVGWTHGKMGGLDWYQLIVDIYKYWPSVIRSFSPPPTRNWKSELSDLNSRFKFLATNSKIEKLCTG